MEHKLSPTAPTGRHGRDCRICLHPQREQIEQDFCAWESAAKIAKQYRIGSRTTIYRHARAFNLFSQRDRQMSMALGRIIERGANCRVTASVVVAACMALARLNSRGQLVTRSQSVDINALFDKMNRMELEAYACSGQLPKWFEDAVSATRIRSIGNGEDVN
jgi:hypothetical protein